MKNLGKEGKDKVTGFKGIIIGKINYLTGCDHYGIAPPVDKDGKVGDTQWFDEGRVEIIGEGVHADQVKSKKKGGPSRDTPRM